MDPFALLIAVLVALGLGFYWGYRLGVEETEGRWKAAVNKAEWNRQWQQSMK